MWSAYVQYCDTTGYPSSWTNASISAEMDWIGNGVDDANQRQILSLVLGQYNASGLPAELSSAVGISLATGSTGKVYRVFNVSVPYSISVLDTSSATQLPAQAAIRLAAGQSVAFEATNTVNLTYSSPSGAIVANYRATSCAIRPRYFGFLWGSVQHKRHDTFWVVGLYRVSDWSRGVHHNLAASR